MKKSQWTDLSALCCDLAQAIQWVASQGQGVISVHGTIALRHAGNVLLEQWGAGHFACAQAGHQFGGRAVSEIGHAEQFKLE